jgi:hypothetical protein
VAIDGPFLALAEPAPTASDSLPPTMNHLQQVFAYLATISYVCCAAFFALGAILSWLSTPRPW